MPSRPSRKLLIPLALMTWLILAGITAAIALGQVSESTPDSTQIAIVIGIVLAYVIAAALMTLLFYTVKWLLLQVKILALVGARRVGSIRLPSTGKAVPNPPTPHAPGSTPTSSVFEGVHKQRLAILACSIIGMVAVLLPWVHVPIVGSIPGSAGEGWIRLLLFAPAAWLALVGPKDCPIVSHQRLGATIPAAIAVCMGVVKMAEFHSRMQELPRDNPLRPALTSATNMGAGLYLFVAAGAFLVASAWLWGTMPASREQECQPNLNEEEGGQSG